MSKVFENGEGSLGRKPYPAWVCSDCGKKYGRRIPTCATWHIDKCGVCDKETMVTNPPRPRNQRRSY